jgi:hypothetical protein
MFINKMRVDRFWSGCQETNGKKSREMVEIGYEKCGRKDLENIDI